MFALRELVLSVWNGVAEGDLAGYLIAWLEVMSGRVAVGGEWEWREL